VWAISHTKDNYLSVQYHHIAQRRGKQKAVVAVSHSVLVILYHVLRDKSPLVVNDPKGGRTLP